MKIILVVANSRRKRLVFVSNGLRVLSLEEAMESSLRDEIEGVCVVNRESGSYLRTMPKIPKNEELEQLSVSSRSLLSYIWDARHIIHPALQAFVLLYLKSLEPKQPYITPVGNPRVLTALIRSFINSWKHHLDLTQKPEIIATLYHLSYVKPHAHPEPNERGSQIVNEFYPLSQKWLK